MIRDFTTRGPDRDVIVLADTMFSNFTGDDGADLVAGGFLRANISYGMTEVQVNIDGGGNSWQTIAELCRSSSSNLPDSIHAGRRRGAAHGTDDARAKIGDDR
jgi:hypothetical protein